MRKVFFIIILFILSLVATFVWKKNNQVVAEDGELGIGELKCNQWFDPAYYGAPEGLGIWYARCTAKASLDYNCQHQKYNFKTNESECLKTK